MENPSGIAAYSVDGLLGSIATASAPRSTTLHVAPPSVVLTRSKSTAAYSVDELPGSTAMVCTNVAESGVISLQLAAPFVLLKTRPLPDGVPSALAAAYNVD